MGDEATADGAQGDAGDAIPPLSQDRAFAVLARV